MHGDSASSVADTGLSYCSGKMGGMPESIHNPNAQGPFGNTLLHWAVMGGDIEEVRRLLAAGADPRIANRQGQSALEAAAVLGHREIHRLLSS